jgi:hypothetical protein
MKRLINGMFSSIPDAEFVIKTLSEESANIDSDLQMDAKDNPTEPGPSDVGGDDWLPS